MIRILLITSGWVLLSMLVAFAFALGASIGYRRGRLDDCSAAEHHAAANQEEGVQ